MQRQSATLMKASSTPRRQPLKGKFDFDRREALLNLCASAGPDLKVAQRRVRILFVKLVLPSLLSPSIPCVDLVW
jgi:hypothetical protein